MNDKVIKIGEFSKLSGVSTKTLRKWDKSGLLKAYHKDENNKYRYYLESDVDKAKNLKESCYIHRSESIVIILYDKDDDFANNDLVSSTYNDLINNNKVHSISYDTLEKGEFIFSKQVNRVILLIDNKKNNENNLYKTLLIGLLKSMNIDIDIIEYENIFSFYPDDNIYI